MMHDRMRERKKGVTYEDVESSREYRKRKIVLNGEKRLRKIKKIGKRTKEKGYEGLSGK